LVASTFTSCTTSEHVIYPRYRTLVFHSTAERDNLHPLHHSTQLSFWVLRRHLYRMNTETFFPDRQRTDTTTTPARFVASTAQMLRGPAGFDGFGVIRDDQYFLMQQPTVYAGNERVWRCDQADSYRPRGNAQYDTFYPGWDMLGELQHFGSSFPQYPETNVALGKCGSIQVTSEACTDCC
jgi:hypothetical protein